MSDNEKPVPLTGADFPAGNLPSLFVNQFYVVVAPASVRIAVGEQVFIDQVPNFHSVVTMPLDVAKQLITVLSELIEQEETKAKAQKAGNGS